VDQGGRPSKQTPETIAKICDALSHGLSNEDAAAHAGISIRTFYEWQEDEEFQEAIRGAKASKKLALVKKLLESTKGGAWQQYAWLLERLDICFCRPEVRLAYLIHDGKQVAPDDKTAQVLKDLQLLGYGNGKRE
jgi:hypothetical protein